jgi:broad specificity phosphatase PhoE
VNIPEGLGVLQVNPVDTIAEMNTAILLIRHGRTALNAQQRYRGFDDPPLDAVGGEEVMARAIDLAAEPIRAVFASPLRRALETAEAIAAPHGLHVEPDPGLADIDYGPWTGLTQEEAAERSPVEHHAFRSTPMSAGTPAESVADVLRRVLASLSRISTAHDGQLVAAVSHDVPIRAVRCSLQGLPEGAFWDMDVPTASVTWIDVNNEGMWVRP